MRRILGNAWLVAAVASAAVLAPAALAVQPTPPAPPAAAVTPKPPAAPAKDADLPPNIAKLPFEVRDGYRKVVKRCTTCHDTKRIEQANHSLFDWEGVIGTMSFKKGANIPQEERHSIFLYLAYLNGTNGTPEEKDQYLTFLNRCEDCHGVGLIYKDKKPMKDWPTIIHRMAGKGQAHINPDDEKKVLAYINRMYPDLFGVE